jgi:hypothetical protein
VKTKRGESEIFFICLLEKKKRRAMKKKIEKTGVLYSGWGILSQVNTSVNKCY